jgi:hypothetical protein
LRVESYNGNGSKINSNEPNGGRREVVRGTIAEFFYDAACEPFFPDSDDDKGKHFVSFPLNGRPINEAIQEYFKKNLIRGYISN